MLCGQWNNYVKGMIFGDISIPKFAVFLHLKLYRIISIFTQKYNSA